MAEQDANVIVAIPSVNDYVWKTSSEKIPHMTLLYLEDLSSDPDLEHVVEFLSHVVDTSLSRFSLSVDRRDTLGADNADVIFFSPQDDIDPTLSSDRTIKRLANFRQTLLQDSAIFQAYEAVQQFPTWNPHLTLGYPSAPAHPDNRDYPGISWVSFDKIALWTGDFDGPEFMLKENKELCMLDDVFRVLAHKEKTLSITVSSTPWSNFKQSDYTLAQWIAACLIAPAKPSIAKNDYKLPVREPSGTLNKNAVFAAASVLAGGRGGVIASTSQKAEAKRKLVSIYNQMGQIPPDSLTHVDLASDILEHHGVKGMHWGIHREHPSAVTATQKLGKKVKTSGGHNLEAHPDAIKTAVLKQKAKKSTTDSLSNAELKLAVERMNLEQQFSRLSGKKKGAGQQFAEEQLKAVGRQKIASVLAKKAVKTAAVAAAL